MYYNDVLGYNLNMVLLSKFMVKGSFYYSLENSFRVIFTACITFTINVRDMSNYYRSEKFTVHLSYTFVYSIIIINVS